MTENKNEMSIIYEKYCKRDDIKIEADGRIYYRIIHKEKLSINSGLILVTVPRELFGREKISCSVIDERGRTFELGGSVYYSFESNIPRWYLETLTVDVINIGEVDELGDYLAIKE